MLDEAKIADYSFESGYNILKLRYKNIPLYIKQFDETKVTIASVPLSCFALWSKTFDNNWNCNYLKSVGLQNVNADDLYGYFYVAALSNKVDNAQKLFSGYTAAGCRTVFDRKTINGIVLYNDCKNISAENAICVFKNGGYIEVDYDNSTIENHDYNVYFCFVDGVDDVNEYAVSERAKILFSGSSSGNDSSSDNSSNPLSVPDVSSLFKKMLGLTGIVLLFVFVGCLFVFYIPEFKKNIKGKK